jgi:hypothetical protein
VTTLGAVVGTHAGPVPSASSGSMTGVTVGFAGEESRRRGPAAPVPAR